MSILSFFKSDIISPEWTFSGGGVIWRMVLAGHGTLVGECRDPDKKVASFFCVDIASGKARWTDRHLDQQWWVGIEGVVNNVVLFHGFAKPDMPQHKGIQALDVGSGTELWRNNDVAYWFGLHDRVIAYRDMFEKRVGYELDLHSGAQLKVHDTSLEELHDLRRQTADDQSTSGVILPEIFVDEGVDHAIAMLVGKETKGKELSGRVEYIRQGEFLVFNFHVRRSETEGLENNLVVYRETDQKRVFNDVIGRNLAGYVPDSFFVQHPFVLFIKDRRVLTALRLWKS